MGEKKDMGINWDELVLQLRTATVTLEAEEA
jgi:hypothetical protein